MSDTPADEERLDSDPTDELPILLETAVLEPGERRVALVVGDDATGEHTAHYAALAAQESANVDALKSDLERRSAKVAALEEDISRLSSRWLDIERHLTAKDKLIDELNATLGSLRGALESRYAGEQRLTAEIAERDSRLARAREQTEQLERNAAVSERNLAEVERNRQATLDELADARKQLAEQAAVTRETPEPGDLQSLREEVATLASYISNRRAWWDEIEARAAAQATRIAELEREVAHRTERQQRTEARAEREVANAKDLREQLVVASRRAETLDSVLAELRADPRSSRTSFDALQSELTAAKAAAAEAQTALAAATHALEDERAARLRRDEEHTAALASADERRAAALAAVAESERAMLEAQTRQLSSVTAELEASRRELAAAHAAIDQARSDAAHIERAVVDKDRALEARDERIATLQAELDQKMGALQKLNAMDLSLQGLDSKMSERLRQTESPVDQPNTPALVCLTGDVPRQYGLTKKTMTMGRSSRCDIQILTHFVSREHARLTVARSTVVVEDLGSTNGIFVNSVRVDRQELRHGDLLTVGETQFRFLESMAH